MLKLLFTPSVFALFLSAFSLSSFTKLNYTTLPTSTPIVPVLQLPSSNTSVKEMSTPIPEESKVSYRFLGRSGLKVSNIALGCADFGKTQVRCSWLVTQSSLA